MRAYVVTTGIIFGLITAAHIWRMVDEWRRASEPWYMALTLAAAGLCVWSVVLLGRSRRG